MMHQNDQKKMGIATRLKRALVVSLEGLRDAWKGEQAFRMELVASMVGVPVAFLLPISLTLSFILVGSLFLILIVELVNSAIEAIVDLVTQEWHPLAKNAKDMGSAAVLVAIILAGIVWSLTFITVIQGYLS